MNRIKTGDDVIILATRKRVIQVVSKSKRPRYMRLTWLFGTQKPRRLTVLARALMVLVKENAFLNLIVRLLTADLAITTTTNRQQAIWLD